MKASIFLTLIAAAGFGACSPISSEELATVSEHTPMEALSADSTCTLTAYSGRDCHGNAGNQDGSEHKCINTAGRHSFYMSQGCTHTRIVNVFQRGGCGGVERQITAIGGRCYNVNTGYNWSAANFHKA